jgi:hypothetical protein
MKKTILTLSFFLAAAVQTYSQEYKVITTIESIVPGGVGRSRMIEEQQPMDYKSATTSRETKGDGNKQKDVDRGELKIDKFEETKMLNFYSMTGINFQNIASNDALVSSKINSMSAEGWDLLFVTSGVESNGGRDDGEGIFITRYIFYRKTAQNP